VRHTVLIYEDDPAHEVSLHHGDLDRFALERPSLAHWLRDSKKRISLSQIEKKLVQAAEESVAAHDTPHLILANDE
jgi:hypothetical protein